jgi:hypothetical protein
MGKEVAKKYNIRLLRALDKYDNLHYAVAVTVEE